MIFLNYEASVLPEITLIGKETSPFPHKNIRRISDEYIFYIVTSGELHFCEDGKEYTLKKGDCFLFESGLLHYGTINSYYNLIYVHFKHPLSKISDISLEEWKDKVNNESRLRISENKEKTDKSIFIPKISSFGENPDFYNICNLAEQAVERMNLRLESNNTLCSLKMSEMFIELYRMYVIQNSEKEDEKTNKIHLVNRVIKYLNQNYSKKITGDIISADICYNFDYLNQLFKKYLKTSIFKTLEHIRIEAAQNLIKGSDFSLEEIGERVGFKNESYFSKTFKKQTGLTPSKYRASLFGKDL